MEVVKIEIAVEARICISPFGLLQFFVYVQL